MQAQPAVTSGTDPAAGYVQHNTPAGDDASRISCRVHVVNNTDDAATFGALRSAVRVAAAADVQDVSAIVQLAHPDVAALEVCAVMCSVPPKLGLASQ